MGWKRGGGVWRLGRSIESQQGGRLSRLRGDWVIHGGPQQADPMHNRKSCLPGAEGPSLPSDSGQRVTRVGVGAAGGATEQVTPEEGVILMKSVSLGIEVGSMDRVTRKGGKVSKTKSP